MLKLGPLKLGSTAPRVAVSFTDAVRRADIDAARKAGVAVAELRLDRFKSLDAKHVVKKLALFKGFPTIATIRLKKEGGAWTQSEARRQDLFDLVMPHVDAVDLELDATATRTKIGARAQKCGKLLIVSYHDCKTTPDLRTLKTIVKNAEAAGADIVKIATHIKKGHPEHVRVLTALLAEHPRKNLIVIGMGDEGIATRLVFPRLGSLITFAFAGDFRAAPGQLPYGQMIEMLRQLYPAHNREKTNGR